MNPITITKPNDRNAIEAQISDSQTSTYESIYLAASASSNDYEVSDHFTIEVIYHGHPHLDPVVRLGDGRIVEPVNVINGNNARNYMYDLSDA